MKRTLGLLLGIMMLCGMLSGFALAAEVLPGDVDRDGQVNSTDARMVLQYKMGLLETLPVMEAADVNADGDINSTDARLILQREIELFDDFNVSAWPAPPADAGKGASVKITGKQINVVGETAIIRFYVEQSAGIQLTNVDLELRFIEENLELTEAPWQYRQEDLLRDMGTSGDGTLKTPNGILLRSHAASMAMPVEGKTPILTLAARLKPGVKEAKIALNVERWEDGITWGYRGVNLAAVPGVVDTSLAGTGVSMGGGGQEPVYWTAGDFSVSITPSPAAFYPGGIALMAFNLEQSPNFPLTNGAFTVCYDADKLEPILEGTAGTVTGSFGDRSVSVQWRLTEPGRIECGFATVTPMYTEGTVPLFGIVFALKEGQEYGDVWTTLWKWEGFPNGMDEPAVDLIGEGGRFGASYRVQPPRMEWGDVNNDGAVDSTDARMVLQSEVGLIVLDEWQRIIADVSFDGAVDSTDARMILQYEVGLITSFV